MVPHAHTLVSALFLAAGTGLAAYGLWSLYLAWGSKDWPTVQGEILDADIEESCFTDVGMTYAPRIQYRYEVTGKACTGDRLFIGGHLWVGSRSAAVATIERYPPGSRCKVSYDPAHPGRACLEPGAKSHLYLGPLVGALFAAMGMLGFLDLFTVFR